MTTPNDPHNRFHRGIQASLARLAHIDAMPDDLVRNQADGEALTTRVIAASAKGARSELIATCQRLCLGLPPDDFAPLPALDCESISATQKMLREIVGARVELRAIAKSNARIAALLERSAFSQGESVGPALSDSEETSSDCLCGGPTVIHRFIGSPTSRWHCERCGAAGDVIKLTPPNGSVEAESLASQPASSAPVARHPSAGQAR